MGIANPRLVAAEFQIRLSGVNGGQIRLSGDIRVRCLTGDGVISYVGIYNGKR